MTFHRQASLVAAVTVAVAASEGPARADALALDLDTAIELAERHSWSLADRRDEVAAADARRDEASARSWPRLGITARYTRQNEVEPATLALPGQDPSMAIQLGEPIADVYSLRASFDQLLFDGFARKHGRAAARHGLAAAGLRLGIEAEDLDLRVTEAYVGLAAARAFEELADRSIARFEAHLADLTAKRDAGAATVADVAAGAAQLATARATRARAAAGARSAEVQLRALLGVDGDRPIALVEPLELPAVPDAAAGDRLERRLADENAAAATARARAAGAALWPQLWLRAGAAYERPNPRYFPAEETFDASWDVSLVLSWTFDATTRHAARAADHEARIARRQRARLDEAIDVEIELRRVELTAALERVEAARESVAAAGISVERARELCAAGAGSCTRVLDAEWDHLNAETTELSARFDAHVAAARLERAVGRTAARERSTP